MLRLGTLLPRHVVRTFCQDIAIETDIEAAIEGLKHGTMPIVLDYKQLILSGGVKRPNRLVCANSYVFVGLLDDLGRQ